MKILVVDDHVLFRECLISQLDIQPDMTVIGEAGTMREAIQKAQALEPDVVLLDISLPDGSGIEVLRKIMTDKPGTKVVILTIHDTDELLFTAIRWGAKGFLLKNTPLSTMTAFLRGLEKGEAAISLAMTSKIMEEYARREYTRDLIMSYPASLTGREFEVLEQLETGATNREIAALLYISENTVRVHVHNLLDKLNLKNRRELAHFARENGLVRRATLD